MDYIKMLEDQHIRTDLPKLQIGDYIKLYLKVKEGAKERVQIFEGTVISLRGGGTNSMVTVRRLSFGIGVERVMPLNSPNIDKIEIMRKGKIRRAKLYYLRDRLGKAAKVKERIVKKDKKVKTPSVVVAPVVSVETVKAPDTVVE